MNAPIRALCLALLAILAAPAHSQPPASECPQPRFTGSAPAEYLAMKNPLAKDADVRAAARIFLGDGESIACAKCHGEKGDGRGPMSTMFKPPPRNFRCAATVNDIPDGQLFWIIRFGSPETSMPPHPKLDDAQVWALVAYLRRLAS